jgi:predicted lipoprotein with Yx(FWY)xxD motif
MTRALSAALIVTAAFGAAACGGEDMSANADAGTGTVVRNSGEDMSASADAGTGIVVRQSQFGRMLFNAKRQAIYVFQRDSRNRSNCYGDCAAAWPPVYTAAKPRALTGVKKSLLGTIRRRDGRLQVTYAGKPLYYYAHEGPGQVRCHNVNLNGGYWWVIGPNGKRRP